MLLYLARYWQSWWLFNKDFRQSQILLRRLMTITSRYFTRCNYTQALPSDNGKYFKAQFYDAVVVAIAIPIIVSISIEITCVAW